MAVRPALVKPRWSAGDLFQSSDRLGLASFRRWTFDGMTIWSARVPLDILDLGGDHTSSPVIAGS
jgi:hypothetical protein